MNISVKGLSSPYELEHLARVFYPEASLSADGKIRGDVVYARLTACSFCAGVRLGGKIALAREHRTHANEREAQMDLARVLFVLLRDFTAFVPKWGLLTGVRPVRIVHDMRGKGFADSEIKAHLFNDCYVAKEKADLCFDIANRQKDILSGCNKMSYSLYVSIPFCPSRCSYCSFVSTAIAKGTRLIEPYIAALCRELADTAATARRLGLKLDTIYIGGGTPTAISPLALRQVLQAIDDNYDVGSAREYTVEAGRPDCTTREKLDIIKAYGATRISINPQSMCDEVLEAIGRQHTAKDIVSCYNDARKAGHNNINMDIIAGLPKDTAKGFEHTLSRVTDMNPEAITVHTLTLKRASNIVTRHEAGDYADVEQMLSSTKKLAYFGYKPYYMYRQKKTLQALENTGYAKEGYESLYNVYIMEEVQSILAVGAGASTKLCMDGEIKRIFNYKYPFEYISRFDTMMLKKKGVDEFYADYMDT